MSDNNAKLAKIMNGHGEWKDGVFRNASRAGETLPEGLIGDLGGEITLLGAFQPHTNFTPMASRNIYTGDKPIRLAFVAQMRSGKDTAADFLVRNCGGAVMKFAAPMYDIHDFAVKRLGLVGKQRRLLMLIGTEFGRNTLGENFWIEQFEKDLKNYPGSVYVSDCRFPNEADRLKNLGFTLVKITRPLAARLAAGATLEPHESEQHIDEIETDYEIQNNGTLSEFLEKIENLALEVSFR